MIMTVEMLYDALDKSGRIYDVDLIRKAYEFADKSHDGQKRKSGEAYVTHPIAVAIILVELGMDTESIAAALLHDVVEDTQVTLEELTKDFGSEVAKLVDGVTKLGKVPYSTYEEEQAENVRKMLLAMSSDIRVMLIKLADRLHNMRTISAMPSQKRRDKARETMDVFAPIAHRLGIRAVKEELEDTAIKELDPVAYTEIQSMLHEKTGGGDFLRREIEAIRERALSDCKDVYISGRVKSIFGIYRKLYMQGRSIDEIYDIYAVRIIVGTTRECYDMLGIMHDMFTPIPARFKDYIATPKPNMYQSLHTSVIDKQGIPFEIQIRSWEMHRTAEYGVAAHWKYKAGVNGGDSLESRLTWVRQILEGQENDVFELINMIKSDLTLEEVFVLTPKGDVKVLPVGSCVIDFAYAIHSGVGNKMIGAKVDGRIVPLDYKLSTGQIVEIKTSNSSNPSRHWIRIVKTSEARNKIRSWFKRECRDENVERGKDEIDSEFRRLQIKLNESQYAEFVLSIAKRQHYETVDDFYAAVGYGGILLSRIMPRIKEDYLKQYKLEKEQSVLKLKTIKEVKSGVTVEGLDSCLVKFAQCCNPLPGDNIIGFVTRGYGVSIHKRDCENVVQGLKDEEQKVRYVSANWSKNQKENFRSTLIVTANDRGGLLADISIALTSMHLDISQMNAKESKNCCTIQITTTTKGISHLEHIISTLKNVPGVISVFRSGK